MFIHSFSQFSAFLRNKSELLGDFPKKNFKWPYEAFLSVFRLSKAFFGLFLKFVRMSFFSVSKGATEVYPFFLKIFGISHR